jgi:hypothetical protein
MQAGILIKISNINDCFVRSVPIAATVPLFQFCTKRPDNSMIRILMVNLLKQLSQLASRIYRMHQGSAIRNTSNGEAMLQGIHLSANAQQVPQTRSSLRFFIIMPLCLRLSPGFASYSHSMLSKSSLKSLKFSSQVKSHP